MSPFYFGDADGVTTNDASLYSLLLFAAMSCSCFIALLSFSVLAYICMYAYAYTYMYVFIS